VSDLVFIFCVTGLVFGGTEDVVFSFHILRSQTHFQLYKERRVPFSCFEPPDRIQQQAQKNRLSDAKFNLEMEHNFVVYLDCEYNFIY
jgi:hypothetical protein